MTLCSFNTWWWTEQVLLLNLYFFKKWHGVDKNFLVKFWCHAQDLLSFSHNFYVTYIEIMYTVKQIHNTSVYINVFLLQTLKYAHWSNIYS